jgi:hypothetical protein
MDRFYKNFVSPVLVECQAIKVNRRHCEQIDREAIHRHNVIPA